MSLVSILEVKKGRLILQTLERGLILSVWKCLIIVELLHERRIGIVRFGVLQQHSGISQRNFLPRSG